jgi:hypothetical protein
MTLRSEIEPLLADFKKANGKGSMATANVALTKIIETLLAHIELHQTVPDAYAMAHSNPVSNPVSYEVPPPVAHVSVIDSWSTIDPTANIVTAPLGDVFSPPLTNGPILPPGRTTLLDAVKTLHEANYVIGSDYVAIVDHLKSNPDSTPPVKIRNKPGRKPGYKKPDSATPTSRSKAK